MKKIIQFIAIIALGNSAAIQCWEWPWASANEVYLRKNDEEKKTLFKKEVIDIAFNKSINGLEIQRSQLQTDLNHFHSDGYNYYNNLPPSPKIEHPEFRSYDPEKDASKSDYNLAKSRYNVDNSERDLLMFIPRLNQQSIELATKNLEQIENFRNAILRDDFDVTDLDQLQATLLRQNFRGLEQAFQDRYGLTDEQMKDVNKGFDSYFVGIQKKPGRALYSPMEQTVAQPSFMQQLKGWFAQKRDAAREFKMPSLNLQQKFQMARQAAAQSTKKVAERIVLPSAQAQYDFARTPEGETFSGPRPVQKYEIIPGSRLDNAMKWWKKR